MRFYNEPHQFYAGIDLHARSLHLCVLDAQGQVRYDRSLPCQPQPLLDALAPFRDGLVVGVECMFAWYWLADLCEQQGIAFVLGHALYLKAIHGAKAKNDRIDAGKLARLLRGGAFPIAYVYPRAMRATRDLLRRRLHLVQRRAELLTHLQILNAQYNLPPFPKKLTFAANRAELDIAARFAEPSAGLSATADLGVIDRLDEVIKDLERHLVQTVRVDDVQTFHRLQTIGGVGKILALTLLYEVHDIRRFPTPGQLLSYARLVRCAHVSAGKVKGSGGKKIGNPHLRWAFGEAACLFLRDSDRAKRFKQRLEARKGPAVALAIVAAKLARAVWHVWRSGQAFDEARFWNEAQGTGRRSRNGPRTGSSSLFRPQEVRDAAD
jgi:transposase